MSNPILSKGNGEKVRSPENLNDYIKVSNIGVWILFYILHSAVYPKSSTILKFSEKLIKKCGIIPLLYQYGG